MIEFTSFGKWILAGEHAVLRGHPALVFPLHEKKMIFRANFDHVFSVKMLGDHGHELDLIFHGVVEKALEKLKLTRADLKGALTIESSLPLGAGMGGSAALCVGVARFFSQQGLIKEENLYEFSRDLEDLFHGESSGVDIAVALEGKGLLFQRDITKGRSVATRQPLEVLFRPDWYLSYCGKKGVTSECVKKVRELFSKSPERAQLIDLQMKQSVEKAFAALTESGVSDRVSLLAQSLDQARQCFEQWGLAGGDLKRHMNELLESGALSVKPTGSGGGGYVLSLWTKPPPESLRTSLLRV